MSNRRQSKKRDAILELVKSSEIHPGAQLIYEQLKPEIPALSLGTVYRNIKILLEEGKLVSVGVINGEECFDGEPKPHSHTICTRCGQIKDLGEKESVELSSHFPVSIPGFDIDIKRIVFYGLCVGCKSGVKLGTTVLSR